MEKEVVKITVAQKDLLVGKKFKPESFFNPTRDINGDWFISIEEQQQNNHPDFWWIADLSRAVVTLDTIQ